MNNARRNRYRETIYRRLSESYYPPDAAIMEKVGDMNDCVCEIYPELVRYLPNSAEGIAVLQSDYNRLFVGPIRPLAPPYGSIYRESPGRVMRNSSYEVLDLCGKAGFSADDVLIPDHIAFLLEFAEYLLRRGNSCLESGDARDAARFADIFMELVTAHLARWARDFSQRVSERSDTAFYRDLALFTDLFIHEEADWLAKSRER